MCSHFVYSHLVYSYFVYSHFVYSHFVYSDLEPLFCTQVAPLHLAAEYGHYDIVKYLIDQGALVNIKDKNMVGLCYICLEIKCIKGNCVLFTRRLHRCMQQPALAIIRL